MIEPAPCLHNGSGVGYHADGPLHGGQIAPRNDGRRLIIDSHLKTGANGIPRTYGITTKIHCVFIEIDGMGCTYFETGGTPIDELNCPFAFHRGDGAVDVFGYNVTAVQQTDGHVFPFAWVALGFFKRK